MSPRSVSIDEVIGETNMSLIIQQLQRTVIETLNNIQAADCRRLAMQISDKIAVHKYSSYYANLAGPQKPVVLIVGDSSRGD